MGIISWVVLGLIVGILAKWIMPGKDGGGFIMTTILGVIGALVGGFISSRLGMGTVDGFNIGEAWLSRFWARCWCCLYTVRLRGSFHLR